MRSSTIFSLLEELSRRLLPALNSREVARSYAWQLLTHLFSCSRAELCARTLTVLSTEQERQLDAWVEDLVVHQKPIAYLIGRIPFLNLDLNIRPPILIPRPETEWWSELLIGALHAMPTEAFTCIDLCTGSGCIALAVAKKFPRATVWGVDISAEAIALAQENAACNKIKNCHFIVSNLYDRLPKDLSADIIVANPPYLGEPEFPALDASVQRWEDRAALVSGKDGLDLIRQIIAQAPARLLHRAHSVPPVWLEIGAGQRRAIGNVLLPPPFSRSQVTEDLAGRPRLVRLHY
ncbi:MAG: peptide chain release factor N(5)-glutamine methyltransferase [Candidatus Dependentiae bacterium]|nr:peptide chain release factor N(5)-glutamine methyltransferase [Candidatus Dependentiae bacterium]